MKFSNRTYFSGLAVLAAASLASAADAKLYSFHETGVLGTSLDLVVNANSPEDAEKVRVAVMAEIDRLKKILTTYDATGDAAKLNAALDPVQVAPELLDVLDLYDQWRTKTGGAYTAQVGDLKKLWTDAEKTGTPPTDAQLAAAVEALKQPLWSIDRAAGTAKRLADRQINLDSLGKGYIVSKAVEAAKKKRAAGCRHPAEHRRRHHRHRLRRGRAQDQVDDPRRRSRRRCRQRQADRRASHDRHVPSPPAAAVLAVLMSPAKRSRTCSTRAPANPSALPPPASPTAPASPPPPSTPPTTPPPTHWPPVSACSASRKG